MGAEGVRLMPTHSDIDSAAVQLHWTRRAMPWTWLAVAVVALVCRADPALVVGPIIMAKISDVDNDWRRLAITLGKAVDRVR